MNPCCTFCYIYCHLLVTFYCVIPSSLIVMSSLLVQLRKVYFIIYYNLMYSCLGNVELVNRLLLDAGITSDLIKIWRQKELQ